MSATDDVHAIGTDLLDCLEPKSCWSENCDLLALRARVGGEGGSDGPLSGGFRLVAAVSAVAPVARRSQDPANQGLRLLTARDEPIGRWLGWS
jgi:hypothetical protein